MAITVVQAKTRAHPKPMLGRKLARANNAPPKYMAVRIGVFGINICKMPKASSTQPMIPLTTRTLSPTLLPSLTTAYALCALWKMEHRPRSVNSFVTKSDNFPGSMLTQSGLQPANITAQAMRSSLRLRAKTKLLVSDSSPVRRCRAVHRNCSEPWRLSCTGLP